MEPLIWSGVYKIIIVILLQKAYAFEYPSKRILVIQLKIRAFDRK
jgi:adenylate cyclase